MSKDEKLKTQKDIYDTEPYTNATEFMKAERQQAIKILKSIKKDSTSSIEPKKLILQEAIWSKPDKDGKQKMLQTPIIFSDIPWESSDCSAVETFIEWWFNITEEELSDCPGCQDKSPGVKIHTHIVSDPLINLNRTTKEED